MDDTDQHLLERYCHSSDQAAFGEVLRRHLNLVHSTALRQVRSPQLAEEVAQSVFTHLARRARFLAPGTILPAWLWQVARRMAINVARREARRRHRERIACELSAMNDVDPDWTRIEPLLDEALQALPATDRAVVLLRWFEGKSLREIAAVLQTGEDAVRKRGSRALDRLRDHFARRGVTTNSGALAATFAANAAQAAPAGLAATLAEGALANGAAAEAGWFAALLTALSAMTNTTKAALAVALIVILAIPVSHYLQPAAQPVRPSALATIGPAAPLDDPAAPREYPPAQSDPAKADPGQPPALAEAVAQLLQPPPSPLGTMSGAITVKLGNQEISNRITLGYGATTSFALANGITATIVAMKDPKSDLMFYDFDLRGTGPDGKPIWMSESQSTTSGKPVIGGGTNSSGNHFSFSFTPD